MLPVILTLCFALTLAGMKRHVPNRVAPDDGDPPTYDVAGWVTKLHLQRCAIVEIGEGHCAIFVESFEPEVREYFLGICELEVVEKWKLCSDVLEGVRPKDCSFKNVTVARGVRVHRRLCDLSNIAYYGQPCRCDLVLANRPMFKVTGFPTCFQAPLPSSICEPLNVCGVHACTPGTATGKIHTAECNPSCLGRRPFCELSRSETSHLPSISSFWTDWSEPLCSDPACSTGLLYTEATCVSSVTGGGAVDCLGPGTSCCPGNALSCKCNTYMEDGFLKLFRTYANTPPPTEELFSPRPDDLFMGRLFRIINKVRAGLRKRQADYVDDDDPDDTGGEDIAIEEDGDDEGTSSTTESPERAEVKLKMLEEANREQNSNLSEALEGRVRNGTQLGGDESAAAGFNLAPTVFLVVHAARVLVG